MFVFCLYFVEKFPGKVLFCSAFAREKGLFEDHFPASLQQAFSTKKLLSTLFQKMMKEETDDYIIRARGLPWSATKQDIEKFFSGMTCQGFYFCPYFAEDKTFSFLQAPRLLEALKTVFTLRIHTTAVLVGSVLLSSLPRVTMKGG